MAFSWKAARDIMRKDSSVSTEYQRLEEFVSLVFLRIYNALEEEWADEADSNGKAYTTAIPSEYQWGAWAIKRADGTSLTGDSLVEHLFAEQLGFQLEIDAGQEFAHQQPGIGQQRDHQGDDQRGAHHGDDLPPSPAPRARRHARRVAHRTGVPASARVAASAAPVPRAPAHRTSMERSHANSTR